VACDIGSSIIVTVGPKRALYLLTTTAQAFSAKLGFAASERSEVPSAIAATAQFRSLCPSTAACMVKDVCDEARDFPFGCIAVMDKYT